MKTELQNLFDGLNTLCESNEAFYFSEQDYLSRYVIRSYSYRLASWTDFQLPFAKESRGTAFIFDKETQEWSLFCRAYRKFFNLGEGIDKEEYMSKYKAIESYNKEDGSLLLVGRVNGTLVTKTKTSINSDQARMAQKLLDKSQKHKDFCNGVIDNGFSPVFEFVGPDNRIVINYSKNELILLGLVDNDTGEVSTRINYNIKQAEYLVYSWIQLLEIQENSKEDIEGFVVKTSAGEFVKVKTNSYKNKHHVKDNIDNFKNLIPLILNDDLDDIMDLFADDENVIKRVIETQELVFHDFNHNVVLFKELRRKYFHDFNENRKDFAMKHKDNELFGYVMRTLKTSFRDVEKTAENAIMELILKKTSTLGKANEYIENLKTKKDK